MAEFCSADIVSAGGRLVTIYDINEANASARKSCPYYAARTLVTIYLGQDIAEKIADRKEKDAGAINIFADESGA